MPVALPRRGVAPLATLVVLLCALGAGPPGTARAADTCNDDCRLAGARAYVAALVSHDPSAVPFHPRATRVEAGVQTGFSGDQLRADLRFGPQYRVIRAVRDERYVVRPDGVVVADVVLDVGLGPLPVATARVHETFRDEGGLIREIVADISLAGPGPAGVSR